MRSFTVALLCALAGIAASQAKTPVKGSALRTAILDAIRVPVQKELRQKVQFKVDWMKTLGEWAFMKGVPQLAGGGKIDYSKTPYRQAIQAGAFDNWICALLRKKRGTWTVVKYVIGATDVVYEPWAKDYHVPPSIFDIANFSGGGER